MRKLKEAVGESSEHTLAHEELTHTMPTGACAEWTEAIEAWEDGDRSGINPFEIRVPGTYSVVLY